MTTMVRMDLVNSDDGRVCQLTRECTQCATDVSMRVFPADLEEYLSGAGYIQEIFPYLTPGERELLINGICDPCFNKLFPPEEEEG